jgi:hypothetical protein
MSDLNDEIKHQKELNFLYDEPEYHADLWLFNREYKTINIDEQLKQLETIFNENYRISRAKSAYPMGKSAP